MEMKSNKFKVDKTVNLDRSRNNELEVEKPCVCEVHRLSVTKHKHLTQQKGSYKFLHSANSLFLLETLFLV